MRSAGPTDARPCPAAFGRTLPEPIEIHITVPPSHHGWRLDRFIHWRIPRLSRSRIQRMIRSQHELGGAALRPASRVQAHQQIVLLRPAPEEPEVPRTFDLLYEDSCLVAISKPAGLPVHATARYLRNTLVALLRDRFLEGAIPQPAHRLDRETSGLMLLGRTPGATSALKESFRRRRVRKRYLAIVWGHSPDEGVVDLPLGPDVASGIRVKIGVVAGGQLARTRFHTLQRRRGFSLIEAWPETGRQHQIRAHLQALGHPIVGDKLYGADPGCLLEFIDTGWTESLQQRLLLPRQALHAAEATFPHPASGRCVCLRCLWPEDLSVFWESQTQ